MRFGIFEVDLEARELRKSGRRVPLQDQPFEILCALLERPGEVVTREEIQRRLWPSGVHVEYEAGVNKAVLKLRDALGDSAESPRFIETLPRRGYRFLAEVGSSASGPDSTPRARGALRLSGRKWAASIALLSVVALALFAAWRARVAPNEDPPLVRFTVPLPSGWGLAVYNSASVAFSPDGKRFALAARSPAGSGLFVRSLDGLEAVPLPGTDGARSPFFSPDGDKIGYDAGDKLRRVAVTGGDSLTLADTPFPAGAAFDPADGSIVFVPSYTGGLFRLARPGAQAIRITTPDRARGEGAHVWPSFLPGGRGILFTIWSGSRSMDQSEIAVLPARGGPWKVVVEGGLHARYLPSGHLLFLRGGVLSAAPFDLEALAVTGPASPVIEGVASDADGSGTGLYDVSPNGSLVYAPGGPLRQGRRLVIVDRQGSATPVREALRAYLSPRLSRDGRRLALWIEESQVEVWLGEFGSDVLTRTTNGLDDHSPAWSPDGRSIAFESGRNFVHHLFVRSPAEGGSDRQVTSGTSHHYLSDWSPDGRFLAYTEFHPETGADVWVVGGTGSPAPRPVVRSAATEKEAAFSRDGRWLAYVSDESGRNEVYVRPFPEEGRRVQVSLDGGEEPAWSRTRDELFFRNGRRLFAARMSLGAEPSADKPLFLFEGPYHDNIAPSRSYDTTPDGCFVMVTDPSVETLPREVRVVLGFSEDLKRRFPRR